MGQLEPALDGYLQTLQALIRIKSQHELIFDGKANALARAGRSHLCIATVCAEDAVPKDDVTTVVGVRLTALKCMMAMMLLCGGKEPVPYWHRDHGQVGVVKFTVPHAESCRDDEHFVTGTHQRKSHRRTKAKR